RRSGRKMRVPSGAIVGFLSLLLRAVCGEPIPATVCPGGQSWSLDLEKCMDCAVCQRQDKNDFCSTCGDPQSPDPLNMWLLIGVPLGAVVLVGFVGAVITYTRCRRREKFTTPIEETGGHSAQESLIH
uniref:Tumor necrosis factor receptor superfamily member 12A n=1 Tax=Salvator merianae TaxID=96440 RepID=A0A8D0B5R4_SALMN